MYPGMTGSPADEPVATDSPIQAEVQPEEVPEPPPKPARRRRKKGEKPVAAETPAPAVVPVIEPGTATGEAAEVALPEMPEVADEPAPAIEPAAAAAAEEPSVQTPAAIKPGKKPKGAVVLAIGLPGSGKSTWFKRHGVVPLSSDLMRHLLFDNVQEQRFQDLVFSTLRSLLRARMIARMPWNYVDATNLSPKERRHWIKMAQDFGYEAHAVYFEVPLEICMERNQKRNRIVPADVMQRMSAKLKAPTFDEGFSKITFVRVKQKEE